MMNVATPQQLKRPRCSEKPELPLRAQTDIKSLQIKSKPVRTGPALPFLDEFTPAQAQQSVAALVGPGRSGKKKRCWSANF